MTASSSLNLLVPTKLSPPSIQAALVQRSRLLARLGPVPGTRLTLVVAPAGFGKSTLVASWLCRQGEPRSATNHTQERVTRPAWLTLDEYDQDGLRFLTYLAGAIERVVPDALVLTRPLLTAAQPPPLYVVLEALLVDLNALPGGLILVLDDYHAITSDAVHQALAYLLRHWPQTCKLVLISRIDPPLPLARLRAELQLTEVREADLRFTEAEAEALLTNLYGYTPEQELVSLLHHETEGWALALQLAALARVDTRTRGIATRQITEYLANEVFERQPAPIQAALLAFAVPERICAGLGATLLDPPVDQVQAEAVLAQLMRANLFLLPLDGEGGWYRFHRLFRDLLLWRLASTTGREALRALQLRAAHWLSAAGLADEALRLFLAAGDEAAAGALVEQEMFRNLGRERSAAPPGYWLRLLPPGLPAQRPGLALIEARLASFYTDVPALEASLARVDALLRDADPAQQPGPWPGFSGDLATLRGSMYYWQGRSSEAIVMLQSALELGPVHTLASQALHILGKAFVADGRYDEGVRLLQDELPDASRLLGSLAQATRSLSLCGMHAIAGRVADLADEANRLTDEVAARGLGSFWICYGEAYRGRAAYERSDLEVAAGYFAEVVRRRYQINSPIYIGCLTGLAEIAMIQGDMHAAGAYAQEAEGFANEVGGLFVRHQALGCAVRLALAHGDLAAARVAAEKIGPDVHHGINTWFGVEPPLLSLARVLIAGGDQASLARADAIIADVLAEVEAFHNFRVLVCVLAMQALLRQAQGRSGEALTSLEQAVALAAPRGYVRVFVDRGKALEPLLVKLVARRGAVAYLEAVLAAFAESHNVPRRRELLIPGSRVPEMLTPREQEILALLAERWSDKEIAARLVIAPNTVRKHTSTIFGKLGVGDRRQAVVVARALGLLPGA